MLDEGKRAPKHQREHGATDPVERRNDTVEGRESRTQWRLSADTDVEDYTPSSNSTRRPIPPNSSTAVARSSVATSRTSR